jgi:hypothetical protein
MYPGLALGLKYVEGFVEGCLVRIGEDDPDEETFLQDLWEEGEVHQAYKLLRLQQSPLVSLNVIAYALVHRRKGS